ncbi:MAG TPA: flagellin [Acetobacteraceae bacterium]|nr:flagellin [Acetobacteraceae bacterium]
MIGRVSSFAGQMQLDYSVQSMQSQMNQLVGEVSSGEVANPAQSMGNDATLLYQLEMQSNEQTTLQTSTTNAGQQLDTIQTALSSIATATQSIVSQAQETASEANSSQGYSVLASEASSAMTQIIDQLNTSYDGTAVFAGDGGSTPPMTAADASNGPLATINAVLSNAVAANGGNPLTSADVTNLLTGPDGLSSVFSNTNSNPALNYNGSFYNGSTDGNPTSVLIGTGETVQYNASANQPAMSDLLQGLSMLVMLGAPSSQLDPTAQSALLSAANTQLSTAQQEMTNLQGSLGATQSQLTAVATAQQTAATNTQSQILNYTQANTYSDATSLDNLQTQLQASYELTAQISQLSLVHYMSGISAP